MPDDVAHQVLAVLHEERMALRTANFDQLNTLADSKMKLFEMLQSASSRKSDLALIKERLEVNQTLMLAARRGFAEAQERLTAMRGVRESLSFYDQSGQMSQVPTRQASIVKKA